jgi:hypothetical protein
VCWKVSANRTRPRNPSRCALLTAASLLAEIEEILAILHGRLIWRVNQRPDENTDHVRQSRTQAMHIGERDMKMEASNLEARLKVWLH